MTLKDLAVSFHFPKFSTSRDFYKAFGCRVCMLLSYQMISVYQLYIVEDYVHQTPDSTCKCNGWFRVGLF
jgi:hypothetical protein